jgi:hypothetical protein
MLRASVVACSMSLRLSALLAMVLVAGCKGPEARVSRSDTTPAVPAAIESPGALDRAFINVNRAEARYHLLHAGGAIANGDNERAGEELTMSVDHLELRRRMRGGRPTPRSGPRLPTRERSPAR